MLLYVTICRVHYLLHHANNAVKVCIIIGRYIFYFSGQNIGCLGGFPKVGQNKGKRPHVIVLPWNVLHGCAPAVTGWLHQELSRGFLPGRVAVSFSRLLPGILHTTDESIRECLRRKRRFEEAGRFSQYLQHTYMYVLPTFYIYFL